jgi:hypothetical protein
MSGEEKGKERRVNLDSDRGMRGRHVILMLVVAYYCVLFIDPCSLG